MPPDAIEAWLAGPVEGVPFTLQPVAHALLQARADMQRLLTGLDAETLWSRPGGAAAVGFHAMHVAGAIDRLFAYARGESLSPAQRDAAAQERGEARPAADTLLRAMTASVDAALAQLRRTDEPTLGHERRIGKAQLPATVLGILFHAAEHSTRHVGQMITTLKILGKAP